MGNCRSCEATVVTTAARATPTAKVVLQDGELREFEHPVRASHVLTKEHGCFLCNADDLDFDGPISALASDQDLQPGQLYFLLPRSMLRRRLSADEMAMLAVRASTALMKCRCRRGSSVAPLVFTDTPREVVSGGGRTVSAEERKRHRRAGSSGRGRDFTSPLGAIPESAE